MTEYLQNLDFVTLDENDSSSCEGTLTEKESFEAVMSMQNNKSPGSDGISVEFYKTFWCHVKDLLLNSLNEGYRKGTLSDSQRHSVLTLLFKKGDKRNLDNWRPISLLNVDYKIATRALAKRLQNVIPKIISFDQMGFIKKRSATENIRLVQDLLDFCSHTKLPSIFIFLDFKKAFDNIDHDFLFEVLKRYNFGTSLIKWIKTIYKNADGKVTNNGWLSKTFSITKGVRQGCPLSALLFILVVEVFAMKIRNNKQIKGLRIPECKQSKLNEVKISQLADDTTLFVDSIQSGNEAMKEIKAFGTYAGPKLNFAKTQALYLNGNFDECVDGLQWSEEPVKYLGVFMNVNGQNFENLNWYRKIDKIKRIINMWKMRNLTYYGKITIIKALLISRIIYVATVYTVPSKFIIDINKILFSFLWNSKREKVKRGVIINTSKAGGLDMVDIESKIKSLRLSWLSKFVDDHPRPWKNIFNFWLEKIIAPPTCFNINCSVKDMLRLCKKFDIIPFYRDLFLYWAEIRHVDLLCVKNIGEEFLWFNSNIKSQSEMLVYKQWSDSGINNVSDVIVNGIWVEQTRINDILQSNSLLVSFQYQKLKHAFPQIWLEKLRNQAHGNEENRQHVVEIPICNGIDILRTKAKVFYSLFIKMKVSEPNMIYIWQRKLDLPHTFEWEPVFDFKLSKLEFNKIRQFNFKLINNILPFKDNLLKWKISTDAQCKSCNNNESLLHNLLYCPKVRNVWIKIRNLIYECSGEDITIDEQMLVVGYNIDKNEYSFINLIINFMEYSIYKVYLLENYRNKRFNTLFIEKDFKNEFLFYCNYIASKKCDPTIDEKIKSVQNFYTM